MDILVVDDDSLSVQLVTIFLESAGYTVITANDGAEAVRAVALHKPDLVVLDICMPKMSGLDVCQDIRRISDVPIIFMSARANIHDQVRALQLGGDDFLSKPFDLRELLKRIEIALRRAPHR